MNLHRSIFIVLLFLIIVVLESIRPLFANRKKRFRHYCRNIAIFAIYSVFVSFPFSFLAVNVFYFLELKHFGIAYLLPEIFWLRIIVVIVLIDLWMYIWHRLNHKIAFLWRFHRMHHSDNQMDISTAVRFHPGEIFFSSIIRFVPILLIGAQIQELAIYEIVMFVAIFLHHSNFYLPEKIDKVYRLIFVSPWLHWLHHSEWQPETDSNFGTIFSFWDRLAGTFRLKNDPTAIQYGLKEFQASYWQTIVGMLRTPFVKING
jgi:sterol desaturase/sphingolipid hydroxylase (fatty acid hydroxylase superfamily)